MKKKHIHWKDWCWSWNSNTLATWCRELTHLIRSWCWERLKAGGEGDDRRWDGWMASLTWWTWVWTSSVGVGDGQGSLECCSSWGCRVGHNWATELNCAKNIKTRAILITYCYKKLLENIHHKIDMKKKCTGNLRIEENLKPLLWQIEYQDPIHRSKMETQITK